MSDGLTDHAQEDQQPGQVRRGRPRSERAHRAVLAATAELLLEQDVRSVTAEAIAERAGVSKATIYKWWPSKVAVALEAFAARMAADVSIPDTGSVRTDFVEELTAVMRFYTSPAGRTFAQLVAEGQSDPGMLAEFRERFLAGRREAVRPIWKRGVERGELRAEVDPEIALDLVYGPAIYRLLTGHGPLDDGVAANIVDAALGGLMAEAERGARETPRTGR